MKAETALYAEYTSARRVKYFFVLLCVYLLAQAGYHVWKISHILSLPRHQGLPLYDIVQKHINITLIVYISILFLVYSVVAVLIPPGKRGLFLAGVYLAYGLWLILHFGFDMHNALGEYGFGADKGCVIGANWQLMFALAVIYAVFVGAIANFMAYAMENRKKHKWIIWIYLAGMVCVPGLFYGFYAFFEAFPIHRFFLPAPALGTYPSDVYAMPVVPLLCAAGYWLYKSARRNAAHSNG